MNFVIETVLRESGGESTENLCYLQNCARLIIVEIIPFMRVVAHLVTPIILEIRENIECFRTQGK